MAKVLGRFGERIKVVSITRKCSRSFEETNCEWQRINTEKEVAANWTGQNNFQPNQHH
jgi:hypothetical protein